MPKDSMIAEISLMGNFFHVITLGIRLLIMTREARNQRSVIGIKKSSYNNFSPLENEVEFSICNNFGHEEFECRNKFRPLLQKEKTSLNPKIWRKKENYLLISSEEKDKMTKRLTKFTSLFSKLTLSKN